MGQAEPVSLTERELFVLTTALSSTRDADLLRAMRRSACSCSSSCYVQQNPCKEEVPEIFFREASSREESSFRDEDGG